MLSESGRIHQIDKKFNANIKDEKFQNQLFLRLIAKDIIFSNIDFSYSLFNDCYLRKCTFDSCNFTGCRFVGTSLTGAIFEGCQFDYATFEKTLIDPQVLDSCCPPYENLKLRFARTLRINYQQLGDAKSANKAINTELQSTECHLFKAWHSNESYYRKKYSGWTRVKYFGEWIKFKALDFIWGNGESAPKLFRSAFAILLFIAIRDVFISRDPGNVKSYWESFIHAPQIFLGTVCPSNYSPAYLSGICFVRLVSFAFLMSIIIKRLNRR